jgi:polar amino acid transport system substrate-binding protein
MPPYYSKVRVPVVFLICLLSVAIVALCSLSDGYAAPAAEDPPGLWDLKRRPDRPDLRTVQQIRFLTEDEYPPFNFQGPSGKLEGFNVDLARAICAELAVTCTVQARRWDTIVAALEAGQGDVIAASLSGTAEARERLLFTAPYYRTPGRFVALRNGPDDVSPAALKGKRVAVVADTAHQAYLSTYFPGATLVPRPSEAAAREALRSGQADLLFGDGISLAFWLNGSSSGDCCRFAGGPYLESRYFGEGVGMALRPTDDTLRRAIDFALFRIWERGIYADLVRRWFPVSPFGEGL